jgi:hypothetical protein
MLHEPVRLAARGQQLYSVSKLACHGDWQEFHWQVCHGISAPAAKFRRAPGRPRASGLRVHVVHNVAPVGCAAKSTGR